MDLPILSLIIWLPIIIGFFVILFIKNDIISYSVSVVSSFLIFLLSIKLFINFDSSLWQMQFKETINWLPNLGISYSLGIDGFSLPLIILTSFMSLIVIFVSNKSNLKKLNSYLGIFLIMQGLMCGVFAAVDAILFYMFFEAMLIPMFLIIGLWGGVNRKYATIKFFLYTFLGSIFFLIALIYLNIVSKNLGLIGNDAFNILNFYKLNLSIIQQKWLFFAFLIAFAVKIPMWPVHTWLPDAHVEAPTGGSVILAAITLKMGGYGFIRFLLPIVPDALKLYSPLVIVLSLIAIVYIAIVALAQQDMKKLIAYSSISHMGFVTLGIFLGYNSSLGIEGAMMQMISHGFISGALFLCVGVLYERMHSRLINDYGGVVNSMPIFAVLFMVFAMANVGLPGTSGFVGEFLVILAAYKISFWYALFAAMTLLLGASYTLWMYKRVVFADVKSQTIRALQDLTMQEKITLGLLGFCVILFGVWPAPILEIMHVSSEHLVSTLLKG